MWWNIIEISDYSKKSLIDRLTSMALKLQKKMVYKYGSKIAKKWCKNLTTPD